MRVSSLHRSLSRERTEIQSQFGEWLNGFAFLRFVFLSFFFQKYKNYFFLVIGDLTFKCSN